MMKIKNWFIEDYIKGSINPGILLKINILFDSSFFNFLLLSCIFITGLVKFQAVNPIQLFLAICALLGCLACPFLLKYQRKYKPAAIIFIISNLGFLIGIIVFVTGGILLFSSAIWLVIFYLITYLVLGRKAGLVYLLVVFGMLALVVILKFNEQTHYFSQAVNYNQFSDFSVLFSTGIGLAYLFCFTNYYLKLNTVLEECLTNALKNEESLNEELIASEEELRQANEYQQEIIRKLEESERNLNEIQDLAGVSHWSLDLRSNLAQTSERLYELLQEKPGSILTRKDYYRFIHHEDVPLIEKGISKALNHGQASVEHRICLQNNQVYYCRTSIRPIYDKKKKISGLYGSVLNITETIEAQHEIKKLALVVQKSGRIVIITNGEGIVEWVNDAFTRVLGYKPNEVIGKEFSFLFKNAYKERKVYLKIKNSLFNCKEYEDEVRCLDKFSKELWMEINFQPIINANGKINQYVLIGKDITQQKTWIERLVQSEENQKMAQETSNLGSWEIDLNTNKLFWSKQTYHIFDLPYDYKPSVEEAIQYYDEDAQIILKKAIKNTIQTGEGYDLQLRFISAKGVQKWVRSIGKTVCQNNKVVKVYGVIQDITKEREKELQFNHYRRGLELLNQVASNANLNYKEQLDKALQLASHYLNLPYGVISKIEDGVYTIEHYYKPAGAIHLNIQNKLPVQETLCAITIDRKDATAIPNVAHSSYANHPYTRQSLAKAYIGAPILIHGKYYGTVNFLSPETKTENFSESDRDFVKLLSTWIGSVIERSYAEKEILLTKEQAELASMAKAQFLSTMSHEIRTPMNAVIGMTHLLLQDDPRADQVEHLQALRFSSENLLALINDILDFSKIEAGKIEFEKADFNIKYLINSINQSLAYRAQEKGIRILSDLDDQLPEMVVGDPTRLSQILNNLVSNAVKFTEQGEVRVEAKVVNQSLETITIHFAVIDTGIGISQDELIKIFDSFSQASSDTTRKFGGTGLGLAITKRLLDLQKSKIEVESTPGKGANFFFDLGFGISSRQTEKEVKSNIDQIVPDNLKETHILLAEDNPMNVLVARKFLLKWDVILDVANNGKIAVEKALACDYDLVLMDLEMPVMDGYQAATEIKKKKPDLPIIALTASATTDVQEKVFQIGMKHFITKPFNPNDLYNSILKYRKTPLDA